MASKFLIDVESTPDSQQGSIADRAEELGRMDHARLALHALGLEQARDEFVAALREEAAKLRHWAVQSRTAGRSTHQVESMRQRANEIDELVAKYPPKVRP